MKNNIFNKNGNDWKLSIMTDLAVEAAQMLHAKDAKDGTEHEIEGVEMTVDLNENKAFDIKTTWIRILTEKGAEQMGKPLGNYITIESESLKENDVDAHEEIIKILSAQLVSLRKVKKDSVVLVVGLGNWNVTPDALGPKVVSKILVTRHIMDSIPNGLECSVRPVGAVSPGVMGITGIETADIIKGIVDKIKPDLVIAIDALAARHSNRINSTIQISDTGINPGAGMGNNRMALNDKTLGIPVIAIGVPMVHKMQTCMHCGFNEIRARFIVCIMGLKPSPFRRNL